MITMKSLAIISYNVKYSRDIQRHISFESYMANEHNLLQRPTETAGTLYIKTTSLVFDKLSSGLPELRQVFKRVEKG